MIFVSPLYAANDEKEQMADFLNKFTEQHIYHLVANDLKTDEMISFSIFYHWFNSSIYTEEAGKADSIDVIVNGDGDKELFLGGQYVKDTIKRFFDKEIELISLNDFPFDGTKYNLGPEGFMGDSGTPPVIVVTNASERADGNIQVKGYWETIDDSPKKLSAEAILKPHKTNGQTTWSIVSLDVQEDS
jgi:hypothetical protein